VESGNRQASAESGVGVVAMLAGISGELIAAKFTPAYSWAAAAIPAWLCVTCDNFAVFRCLFAEVSHKN
jgi:hypothetical protein